MQCVCQWISCTSSMRTVSLPQAPEADPSEAAGQCNIKLPSARPRFHAHLWMRDPYGSPACCTG